MYFFFSPCYKVLEMTQVDFLDMLGKYQVSYFSEDILGDRE
jgi:hypothetical protein